MSTLVENVAKVTAAHAALKEAIAAKGVTVPEGAKLTDMPALVEGIKPAVNIRSCRIQGNGGETLIVPNVVVCDIGKRGGLSYMLANNDVKHIVLPDGFGNKVYYGDSLFENDKNLLDIVLPDGFGTVMSDYTHMFYGCESLSSVSLPSSFGSEMTIGDGMFNGCRSLVTSPEFPQNFGRIIQSMARFFFMCKSLESVVLPSGMATTSLKNFTYVFYSCSKLKSISFPSNFGTNIQNATNAFKSCYELENITGETAFHVSFDLSSCTKLTHESLMNVINSIRATIQHPTLTLGETNLAKLTDEEKKVATDKGWTLA